MRNMAGETAYDVAAATFEIYICEVLERYEADRWAALKFAGPPPAGAGAGTKRIVPGQGPYNPLALHTTVPVMVYENQRLDTRLKTLAVHGGKPRWSATSAARPHKPDRRPPFAMSPGPLGSRTRHLPLLREEVQLPTRQQPYKLPLPSRSSAATARKAAAARASADAGAEEFATTPTRASVLNERRASASSQPGDAGASPSTAPAEDERSHFWLSEWQPDLTHPLVDVEEGWQYARSFDDSEERWTGEVAPPLARLLDGRGLSSSVSRAVGAAGNANGTAGDQEATPTSWVRRRRWVRVMRRRLDIEFGDELEAAETLPGTALDIYEAEGNVDMSGLDPSADYVARAEYIAGKSAVDGSTPADALGEDAPELWRRIARLEMAVSELRNGAFGELNSTSHCELFRCSPRAHFHRRREQLSQGTCRRPSQGIYRSTRPASSSCWLRRRR